VSDAQANRSWIEAKQASGALPASLQLGECITSRRAQSVYWAMFDGRDAVVKHYTGEKAAQLTKAAADTLQEASARMNSTPFRVPELLYVTQPLGLVVMSRAHGTPMSAQFTLGQSESRRQDLLKKAGAWLNAFTGKQETKAGFYPKFWAARGLTQMPQGARTLHEVSSLTRALDHMGQKTVGTVVSFAKTHGDFIAGNLIVAKDHITGVDIQGMHNLPIARDIATFLVWLTFKTPQMNLQHGVGQSDMEMLCAAAQLPSHQADILRFFIGEQLLRWRVARGFDEPCPLVLATMIDSYCSD